MSYSNQYFDYTSPFTVDNGDDDEITLWQHHHHHHHHHHHQPHLVEMPQPTVDPYQIYDQSNAYDSPRSYNSERRYHSNNRHNNGVTLGIEPVVIQHVAPTAPSQGFNTYNAERQIRERPQVMVEVRTQPARSTQRYYCDHEDCRDPTTGIRRSVSRKADLRRHWLSMHGEPKFDCKFKRCDRKGEDGFYREDHYREHLRGTHNQEVPRKQTRRDS